MKESALSHADTSVFRNVRSLYLSRRRPSPNRYSSDNSSLRLILFPRPSTLSVSSFSLGFSSLSGITSDLIVYGTSYRSDGFLRNLVSSVSYMAVVNNEGNTS